MIVFRFPPLRPGFFVEGFFGVFRVFAMAPS